MVMGDKRWRTVTPSEYAHEREALAYMRERLPDHEPYAAWSNFEFVADDGSLNEVDLLLITPKGVFVVELKGWPGSIRGTGSNWVWDHNGQVKTVDNPLYLTNKKAKRLKGLLQRQKAMKKHAMPFVEAVVFLSAEDLNCGIPKILRQHVFLRDELDPKGSNLGIMEAVKGGVGARNYNRRLGAPDARALARAVEQAGIKPVARSQKLQEFEIGDLLYDSPTGTFQDFQGTHSQVEGSTRRIRIYNVRPGGSQADRELVRKAAYREFEILERLDHPGILRAETCQEHERGTALVYRQRADELRLDQYLEQYKDKITLDIKLSLVRQLAEALKHAHENKVLHRALSPLSVLVSDLDSDKPKIQIFNWQTGYRGRNTLSEGTFGHTVTRHLSEFIEDGAAVYLAPEVFSDVTEFGEYVDIFSLGAISYLVFSGQPPAGDRAELTQRLKQDEKLKISAVVDGAPQAMDDLIEGSTAVHVLGRLDTVDDFLIFFNDLEEALTSPENDQIVDPLEAVPGDELPHGLVMKRRLGSGPSAVVFLVDVAGEERVLKIASLPEHSARIEREAATLKELRHQYIVEAYEVLQFGELTGFLMQRAGKETLLKRIREEGRLSLGMLERFGEDLLEALCYLEREGVYHRDIKPENIGVCPMGKSGELHLMIFDFSLSHASPEDLRAGTPPYLDPFLKIRKQKRYDIYAECFAAAMTLHEMATGVIPSFGDGQSDPALVGNVQAQISVEMLDAAVRESLTQFFQRSLLRDAAERFGNVEEMLRTWRRIFRGLDQKERSESVAVDFKELVARVELNTELALLGLSNNALSALERINVLHVVELLHYPSRQLARLRGVGNRIRREINGFVLALKERFPNERPGLQEAVSAPSEEDTAQEEEVQSLDQIVAQITNPKSFRGKPGQLRLALYLLGLPEEGAPTEICWPSQADITKTLSITSASVSQGVSKLRTRWAKNPNVTALRELLDSMLSKFGGILTVSEAAQILLDARGSAAEDPERHSYAQAALRAAIEVEKSMTKTRYAEYRKSHVVLIASSANLAGCAVALGKAADQLSSSDALVSSNRSIEQLRKVAEAAGVALSDERLLRLAVAASKRGALSPRLEIYPRGLDAARAIRLSAGALYGADCLRVDEIKRRVKGRYPAAEELPSRPELDRLLEEAGLSLTWSPEDDVFCFPTRALGSQTSTSDPKSRKRTISSPLPLGTFVSDEAAVALAFEKRLKKAEEQGKYLVLSVNSKYLQPAISELKSRFDVELVNFDTLFASTLREQAQSKSIDWGMIEAADAAGPDGRDWNKLSQLVEIALSEIESELLSRTKTQLLVFPGLLMRYGKAGFLGKLQDHVGSRERTLPGLWIIVPGGDAGTAPVLGTQAIPVIGEAQWAVVPEPWAINLHRSVGLQ